MARGPARRCHSVGARTPLFLCALAVVSALLAISAPPAGAATFFEVGDAGDLTTNAQQPFGPIGAPLTSISGNLSSGADEDMFRICLTGGGTFSATTVGTPGTLFDTQLFLFNAQGVGVEANDDNLSGGTLRSRLPAGGLSPVAPGTYFLAISGYNNDPLDSGGSLIFPSFPFTSVFGPIDGDAVAGWSNSGQGGTYTINLTGAVICQPTEAICASVPPPPPGAVFSPSQGGAGNDIIYGTSSPDQISGGLGDDIIFGLGGNDQIDGGGGNDTICGGPGDDQIAGSGGNDVISGDAGNDSISGGPGNDRILGDTDADRISGDDGTDLCNGSPGPGDVIVACEGVAPSAPSGTASQANEASPPASPPPKG